MQSYRLQQAMENVWRLNIFREGSWNSNSFFETLFGVVRKNLVERKGAVFTTYGFGVTEDLIALQKVALRLCPSGKKTFPHIILLVNVLFGKLMDSVENRVTGLDKTIHAYYPDFRIDPNFRHNADYDTYLYLLCYLAEKDGKKLGIALPGPTSGMKASKRRLKRESFGNESESEEYDEHDEDYGLPDEKYSASSTSNNMNTSFADVPSTMAITSGVEQEDAAFMLLGVLSKDQELFKRCCKEHTDLPKVIFSCFSKK